MSKYTQTADDLRAEGVSEVDIPETLAMQAIYSELHEMGRRIAEIAGPISGEGGDHEFDGAMHYVWRGLHEALGVENAECMLFPNGNECTLGWAPTPRVKVVQRKAISTSKRKRIMERDGYRCVTCGTHKELSIDHIHPVSRGGGNEDSNLQTMCMPCNMSKGAKL